MRFRAIASRFAADERGAAVVEYALLAALISLVIVGAVAAVGGALPLTLFKIGNSVP